MTQAVYSMRCASQFNVAFRQAQLPLGETTGSGHWINVIKFVVSGLALSPTRILIQAIASPGRYPRPAIHTLAVNCLIQRARYYSHV